MLGAKTKPRIKPTSVLRYSTNKPQRRILDSIQLTTTPSTNPPLKENTMKNTNEKTFISAAGIVAALSNAEITVVAAPVTVEPVELPTRKVDMTKFTAENGMSHTKKQLVSMILELVTVPPITAEMKAKTVAAKKAPKVTKSKVAWPETFNPTGLKEGFGEDYVIIKGRGIAKDIFITVMGDNTMDCFFALYQLIDGVWSLQATQWKFYQITGAARSLTEQLAHA